jgi:hypothetical protein
MIVCRRIDRDGDMSIEWAEWRDFFELCSADTLSDLAVAWRHSLVSSRRTPLTLASNFLACFSTAACGFHIA